MLGYTLIELIITVTLLMGLLLSAEPIQRQFIVRNHVVIIEDKLQHALHYARNKALNEHRTLALAPLHDWSSGMVLFVDNNAHKPRKNDNILQQWQFKPALVQVQWKGFRSDAYILFSPKLANSTASGSFYLSTEGITKKRLIVNRLGHIRSEDV